MIVLDASALVDVVIDQPTKPWVLEQLATASICAPAHQLPEVLSAVARLVRAGVLEPGSARDAVVEARALQQEFVEPTEDHLVRALAMQDRVRVLDGLYVVLAQDRGAPLVSTDQRLARGRLPIAVLAPDAA
jgi:predicted nucleic acid-binding protein